jgi:hypothetical protein
MASSSRVPTTRVQIFARQIRVQGLGVGSRGLRFTI